MTHIRWDVDSKITYVKMDIFTMLYGVLKQTAIYDLFFKKRKNLFSIEKLFWNQGPLG